ncbi:hypothetical protein GOODEAATRI_013985 [Goodea atripinnis]|uniref:Uncharacterized protein n=1 Tax=Goodea atripinnis TaxID=208336 RepID=A0ABV0NUC0_9TELE
MRALMNETVKSLLMSKSLLQTKCFLTRFGSCRQTGGAGDQAAMQSRPHVEEDFVGPPAIALIHPGQVIKSPSCSHTRENLHSLNVTLTESEFKAHLVISAACVPVRESVLHCALYRYTTTITANNNN